MPSPVDSVKEVLNLKILIYATSEINSLEGIIRFSRCYLFTALPWAGKGDRENQIHLDEVHDILIALV